MEYMYFEKSDGRVKNRWQNRIKVGIATTAASLEKKDRVLSGRALKDISYSQLMIWQRTLHRRFDERGGNA